MRETRKNYYYLNKLSLNAERCLRYLVPKWLINNAKNQSQKMSKKEARDLYDVFRKQVNFHSPDMESRTFKVSVGNPKIRGRRYMTLTPMSLSFNIYENAVRIYSDIWESLPRWCYDVIPLFGMRDMAKNLIKSNLAVHPHVSSTGSPCLGDYGNGWSQAIVSGNIPMLTNVARSFINNWTRGDAYWNVNVYNEQWENHKIVPFHQYLTGVHFWYEVANRREASANTLHQRGLYRLMNRHDETGAYLFNSLLSLGYEPNDIMHWWFAVNHFTMNARDDENEIIRKHKGAMSTVHRVINSVIAEVDSLHLPVGMKYTGLIHKTVIRDFEHKIIPESQCNLWSSNDATLWESTDSFTYICNQLRDGGGNTSRSRYNYPTASDILQMKSTMNRYREFYYSTKWGKEHSVAVRGYRRMIKLEKSKVCTAFGKWWVINLLGSTRKRKKNSWILTAHYLLNRLKVRTNNGERMYQKMALIYSDKGEDGYEQIGKYIYKLIMDIHKNYDELRNMVFNKQLEKELVSDVLELITLNLKTAYGEIDEQNRKARRRAFGDNKVRDGGENQLSLETF